MLASFRNKGCITKAKVFSSTSSPKVPVRLSRILLLSQIPWLKRPLEPVTQVSFATTLRRRKSWSLRVTDPKTVDDLFCCALKQSGYRIIHPVFAHPFLFFFGLNKRVTFKISFESGSSYSY